MMTPMEARLGRLEAEAARLDYDGKRVIYTKRLRTILEVGRASRSNMVNEEFANDTLYVLKELYRRERVMAAIRERLRNARFEREALAEWEAIR